MEMTQNSELLLGTPNELKQYLDILPPNKELRFPSITSLDEKFAVTMIIYNNDKKAVLLTVYNTTMSGLPKDKVETDDSIDDTSETPFTLARFGTTKETGLTALRIKMLGMPKKVKNTNPLVDSEFHDRWFAFIDKTKGNVTPYDELLSPKNGPHVWVKTFLLNVIFEKPRQIAGIPVRGHSQKEAYKRFIENNLSQNSGGRFSKMFFKKRNKHG